MNDLKRLLALAAILCGVASPSMAQRPSDYYATLDTNIAAMNAMLRQKGDNSATWSRENNAIVLTGTLPASVQRAYQTDPSRVKAVMHKVMAKQVCGNDFINVLALGFSIVGRYYSNRDLLVETWVELRDCN